MASTFKKALSHGGIGLLIMGALFILNSRYHIISWSETPCPTVTCEEGTGGEKSAVTVFAEAAPSVVDITVETIDLGLNGRLGAGERAGSGFVWDNEGHVVTNHHVIEGSGRVHIRLAGGEKITTRLVGVSPDHDLAVIRLASPLPGLKPIPRGRSDALKVGQSVYAIGNPFGLSGTLTTGIISALKRRLPTLSGREIEGAIQTDAAIHPGNSGGPLLDDAGRLIGINTAILSDTGAASRIGFAIPVDVVSRVVPLLIRDGKVPRPGIGIIVMDEAYAYRLGIAGVIIDQVIPSSAAERAGLIGVHRESRKLGDIITAVNDQPTATVVDFTRILQKTGIGKELKLTIQRNGASRLVTVTVMDIS